MKIASFKDYPFRLGTTSFIYPADYVTNVRRLAPRLDEIELLLFESDHLPSYHEISELLTLAQDQDTTFNVHLPMDISMGDPSERRRAKSVGDIARAIERVAPLAPTTHTLHLTCNGRSMDSESVHAWQNRSTESTAKLLQVAQIPSRNISVETLDFAPQWLAPIVSDLDLAVCVDVGHVIRYGYDLPTVLRLYADRITIIHLHGVNQGQDHHAIVHLEPDIQRLLARFLINFSGSLSIEVFSSDRLDQSLEAFPGLMAHAAIENT